MSDSFDPYHRWLGISPKHQPADYYRLLGIDLFDGDAEVIADAADRQMAHVRRYQLGPHSDLSQRMLNELAAAKACLLNPRKKTEYDRRLREQIAAHAQADKKLPATMPPPIAGAMSTSFAPAPPITAPMATSASATKSPSAPTFRHGLAIPRRTKTSPVVEVVKALLGAIAGLGFAYGVLLFGVGIDLNERLSGQKPAEPRATAKRPTQSQTRRAETQRTRNSSGTQLNERRVPSAPSPPPKLGRGIVARADGPDVARSAPIQAVVTPSRGDANSGLLLSTPPPQDLTADALDALIPVAPSETGLIDGPDLVAPAWETPAVPSDVPEEATVLIQEAQCLVADSRYDDARKGLLHVNLVHRDNPQASFYLGLLAGLVEHDGVEARKQFVRARKSGVCEIACLNNLAIAEVRTADLPQAIRYWKEAVQLEPVPAVCHNISLLFSLTQRNRLTLPAAMQKDLQQLLDAAGVTLPTAHGGWRYMDFNGGLPTSAVWSWPNLVDRACLACNGQGTANCPVRACSRGRIRVKTPETIVLPGRQVVIKDRLVPIACHTCRGTGRVSCPFCNNGIDKDL